MGQEVLSSMGVILNAQESDARDFHLDIVRERTINTKLALRKLHLHAPRLLLRDAHTTSKPAAVLFTSSTMTNSKLGLLYMQLRRVKSSSLPQPCGMGAFPCCRCVAGSHSKVDVSQCEMF